MITLLQQTLHPDNLRQAWEEIAENEGIAGVDNLSIRAWRRNWEERLIQLAAAVRANQYRPSRLRRRRIPKTASREWRILRIPTVTDRVLQRAVLQQLYPIYEPRFLDCSYGYRPGRSLKHAVQRIVNLRRQGYDWVLDADIDDFFNQVDHSLLSQFLAQDLPDVSLLPLINCWLTAGQAEPGKGIPIGSPLSPLLANVYLHRLDQQITAQGYALVRYADDFILLSAGGERAQQSYRDVADALAQLHLRYEPRKTSVTTFAAGFEFIGVHFEETWYWYTWQDKRIEVHQDQADWLFGDYGPEYD